MAIELRNVDTKSTIALVAAVISLLRGNNSGCCDVGSSISGSGSGGPYGGGMLPSNLFLASPVSGVGYPLYRQIEKFDLQNAGTAFLDVAQTWTRQQNFPNAGANAIVLPAIRQASGGFDILMPVPSAADEFLLKTLAQIISNKTLGSVLDGGTFRGINFGNPINPQDLVTLASLNSRIQTGTAIGDILYWNGTAWTLLPANTAGRLLQTNGAATAPTWSQNLNPGGTIQGTIITATTRIDAATIGASAGSQHSMPAGTTPLVAEGNTATLTAKAVDGSTNTLTNMPGSGGAWTFFSSVAGFTGTLYGRIGRNDLNASPINAFAARSYKASALGIYLPAGVPVGGTVTVEYVEASSSFVAVPTSIAVPWVLTLTATQTEITDSLFPGRQLVSPLARYVNVKITVSGAAYTGDIYATLSANA